MGKSKGARDGLQLGDKERAESLEAAAKAAAGVRGRKVLGMGAAIPWHSLAVAALAFAVGFGAKGGGLGNPAAVSVPTAPGRAPARSPSRAPSAAPAPAPAPAPGDDAAASSLGASSLGGGELVAAGGLGARVGAKLEARLAGLLEGTFTDECRDLVRSTFEDYLTRSINEDWLPFEQVKWKSECPAKSALGGAAAKSSTLQQQQQQQQQRLTGPGSSVQPADVRLVYLMLVHEQPEQVAAGCSTRARAHTRQLPCAFALVCWRQCG